MLLEFVQGGELFAAIHANKIEGGFTKVHAKFYAAGIVLALGTCRKVGDSPCLLMTPCSIDMNTYPISYQQTTFIVSM